MDIVLDMLAYELAAIFAVLSIWLILRNNKKGKATYEMASQTVKKLKQAKDLRIESLSKVLAEKYGLGGQPLSQAAIDFQDREQQIYKALLNVFVEQDGYALLNIPKQLEKAIDASLDLLPLAEKPTLAAVDSALTLSEQIETTAQQLEVLMTLFRQTNVEQPAKQLDPETEKVSDKEIDAPDLLVNDVPELLEETTDEYKVPVEQVIAEAAEQINDAIEIEMTEEEDLLNSLYDDLAIPDTSADEQPLEEGMTADDVDALLASMDDELQVDSDIDGIDLSTLDNDGEIKEQSQKKSDAELVADTADSATGINDIPVELEVTAEVEAEPEVELEIVVEPEVEPEVETELEIEQPLAQNKMSDYIRGEWNTITPDIYGKTVIQAEPDITANLDNEEDLTAISEPEVEQPLTQNKMSDYIKGEWNTIAPDIYGKTVIQAEPDITADLDNEEELTAISEPEVEQPLVQKKMSDYIKREWNTIVPDIYGKAIIQAEPEVETDLEHKIVASQFDTEEAMLTAMMTKLESSEANQQQMEGLDTQHEEESEPKMELEVLRDNVRARSIQIENENGQAKLVEPEIYTGVDIESDFDTSSLQLPLPDEDALDELLTDVWNLEAESKESGLYDSELMADNIAEPEPEPEPKQIIVDAEHALEAMMMDLTAEPLPSEADLEEMMAEIRKLEQENTMPEQDNERQTSVSNQDELQSILSNIPSFTEMNKKR